jgi:SAM-dependent methyltransferase
MTRLTDERRFFYERFAADFDARMHPAEVARRLEFVFEEALVGELTGKTFLDAGCGTGLFSAAAAQRGARVTSMDIGPALLAEVAKKCDSERVVGDVQALEFEDDAFDVVLSTEVVEHTEAPVRAVGELARVTRPGGVLVVTTPNRRWRPLVTLSSRLGLRPYVGIENWMSFAELEAALRAADVTELTIGGFNAVPVRSAMVQRSLRQVDRRGRGWARQAMVNMFAIARC